LSKKYFKDKKNHVELSVSSVGLETVSSAALETVSSAGLETVSSATSTLETSSVSFFGISTSGLLVISSVGCTTGEFRCCSSSYSLIKRFLSECALVDEPEVVGDGANGGVELVLIDIGFAGGLFKLDE